MDNLLLFVYIVGELKRQPSAVGGALQSSLFELRPDKPLEVGGNEAQS
jgi:hypothetical protein